MTLLILALRILYFLQVHKMICDYDRKEITVWGNANAKTAEQLHKLVSLLNY